MPEKKKTFKAAGVLSIAVATIVFGCFVYILIAARSYTELVTRQKTPLGSSGIYLLVSNPECFQSS